MPEMQQRNPLFAASAATTTNPDPRPPMSIPPWVQLNNGVPSPRSPTAPPALSAPASTVPNTRHYKPGRKWDHLRSASPPLLSVPIADHQRRWHAFMSSGPAAVLPPPDDHDRHHNQQRRRDDGYGYGYGRGRVVDASWVEKHMPSLMPTWTADHETPATAGAMGTKGLMYKGMWLISPERQERTVRLFWRLLLKNAFVPLAFRLTVLAFSAVALGLAASLFVAVQRVNVDADPNNQCAPRASTYMAIIVDTIAVPYIGYVTWDEYMSKPLGLRSVAAKTLLLLCDLYFVVFSASNLSLAFDALFDHRWACYDVHFDLIGNQDVRLSATCPDNPGICTKQRALSGVLLVCLVAWLMTFSVSVMRVVEKLRPD